MGADPVNTPITYGEGVDKSDAKPGGNTGTNTEGGDSRPCPIMDMEPYATADNLAALDEVKMTRCSDMSALSNRIVRGTPNDRSMGNKSFRASPAIVPFVGSEAADPLLSFPCKNEGGTANLSTSIFPKSP